MRATRLSEVMPRGHAVYSHGGCSLTDTASSNTALDAAFHTGETALQREVGVAERMARIGSQVIHDRMPEPHRTFFESLPFMIAGSVDTRGQPVASLLAAPIGFVSSPDPKRLRLDALPARRDPLFENLVPGAPLGLLGIQPHLRRRARANGMVVSRDSAGFALDVRQSFGNCPKYIRPRRAVYVGSASGGEMSLQEGLGERERALMAHADTFFLASAHPDARHPNERSQGVDVSHRGGPPGFVHFTGANSFVVPDFKGNNFFNTLGNLRLSAAAGLLFMDFVNGDVLQVDAHAEIREASHPFAGLDATRRVVQFDVQRARYFPALSPLRFERVEEDEIWQT
jgi:predicted pyridoxine 5'-phosphate oxidase superfamily flavin-nucleotide-binding protein